MEFSPILQKAVLKRRYKRFLADAELEGEAITVHCPNPGSMLGHCDRGQTIWIAPKTGGKLSWGWELAGKGDALTGINTLNANRIAAEAIKGGKISELAGYPSLRAEYTVGDSRLDFLLEDGKRRCFVEVKNVTLSRRPKTAEFPDSPTLRGRKHLELLQKLAEGEYNRAVMLFIVQRDDCRRMTTAADIDPRYHSSLKSALRSGVEVLAYGCFVSPQTLEIGRKMAFIS